MGNEMKYLCIALLAILPQQSEAVDLSLLQKSTLLESTSVKTAALLSDGPTNGEISADEKDTLIQVLCPGPIQTSYSLSQGKSSTCNAGMAQQSASLVQENVAAGDVEIA